MIELREGFNGPFHEADYSELLEAIQKLGGLDAMNLAMVETELMSNASEYIARRDHPGMNAVNCTYDYSFTNLWLTTDSDTTELELEPMCMSKEGLAFALFETVEEPDRLMLTSEEIYRRAKIIREDPEYGRRRQRGLDWEEEQRGKPIDCYAGGTLFDRIDLSGDEPQAKV